MYHVTEQRFWQSSFDVLSVMRQSLNSYDFDLDDRFEDAEDMKLVCCSMEILEPIVRFFGYLYNFNPLTYPKAAEAALMIPSTADEDNDEELDDADESENGENQDNETCEQTVDVSLATQ